MLIRLVVYLIALTMLTLSLAASPSASDYFFRPLKQSDLQNWTPNLEFQLVNPSEKTLMLKVSIRPKNQEGWNTGEVPLKAIPSNLLMRPGTHRRLKLRYDSFSPLIGEENFEILVEQVPVFFASKGASEPPETMVVTSYTADVKVRRQSAKMIVFADQLMSEVRDELPR